MLTVDISHPVRLDEVAKRKKKRERRINIRLIILIYTHIYVTWCWVYDDETRVGGTPSG